MTSRHCQETTNDSEGTVDVGNSHSAWELVIHRKKLKNNITLFVVILYKHKNISSASKIATEFKIGLAQSRGRDNTRYHR